MKITLNFLLQATRVLHIGNYDDDELNLIYNFITKVDNEVFIHYLNSKTVLSYDSDLELYVEIVDALISIYEDSEEYEKCDQLKRKRIEAINYLK
jgi:hypothetical protein